LAEGVVVVDFSLGTMPMPIEKAHDYWQDVSRKPYCSGLSRLLLEYCRMKTLLTKQYNSDNEFLKIHKEHRFYMQVYSF
jgi:hypothetical protein